MTPYQFFKKHAGYSYDPTTETKEQGRRKCARGLAHAEEQARDMGIDFVWGIDPHGDLSAGENSSSGPFWQCYATDGERALASLCGIDFGAGVQPWGQPYKRVVEAELASEAIANERLERAVDYYDRRNEA